MIEQYMPVGLMILVALGFAACTLIVSSITSQKGKTNVAKDHAYECGLPPLTDAHKRFSVKFYLVAMLFILFDVEVVFLYPWAVVFKEMVRQSPAIFVGMLSFLGILGVGFLYALKKNAFEWK